MCCLIIQEEFFGTRQQSIAESSLRRTRVRQYIHVHEATLNHRMYKLYEKGQS